MSVTLLVSNLHESIDANHLEDMFTVVGNVQRVQVVRDENTSASRGIGYVEMSTHEEAADCILRFHGQSTMGQTLVVREDKPHVPVASAYKKPRRVTVPKAKRTTVRRTPRTSI